MRPETVPLVVPGGGQERAWTVLPAQDQVAVHGAAPGSGRRRQSAPRLQKGEAALRPRVARGYEALVAMVAAGTAEGQVKPVSLYHGTRGTDDAPGVLEAAEELR